MTVRSGPTQAAALNGRFSLQIAGALSLAYGCPTRRGPDPRRLSSNCGNSGSLKRRGLPGSPGSGTPGRSPRTWSARGSARPRVVERPSFLLTPYASCKNSGYSSVHANAGKACRTRLSCSPRFGPHNPFGAERAPDNSGERHRARRHGSRRDSPSLSRARTNTLFLVRGIE